MAAKPKTLSPLSVPAEEIHTQLARIQASHQFRNSRRCQALLNYVVETACTGHIEDLKERVVGAAVFGREADYDTNQDAVVRNAAAEVRKRLAQYYLEPEHESELRIELPSGSYLPEFKSQPPAPPPPVESRWPKHILPAALAIVAVAALAFVLIRSDKNAAISTTDLDRFWKPVLTTPGAVQMCVGQSRFYFIDSPLPPDPKATIPVSQLIPLRDHFTWAGDANCQARLTGYLMQKGKEIRYRGALTTPYAELRGNPVVLIGAFNNEWTIRLTENLRFAVVKIADGRAGIRDATRPASDAYVAQRSKSFNEGDEDFAIITRVFDPDTERWLVAAGGITHYGTMMAGEFLADPAYFREAARNLSTDWSRKNIQVVLQTKLVGGTPGPPRVLVTHVW